MYASSITRAVALTAFVAAAASAQSATSSDTSKSALSELARRSAGSVSLMQSRPQGAFGRSVGLGYGVNGAYLFRLDDAGVWSLRADAGVVTYGGESRRAALSESIGDRVQVDVETHNYIVPLTIGTQLEWPSGPVRPYVNAGVGGQLLFTESHLEGTESESSFASTRNHSAWTSAWVAGGGVALPVYVGKTSVQLDLGVQYVAGGRTRYLTSGSIQDLPGGAIRITPLESETHMLLVRLGARISR
jgi:opacity protein-like surface antigen